MSRLIVGPFNRVEGDLEIRLEVEGGLIREAFVGAPLHRGFEQILAGRPPLDALVVAPRVCGICSASQSAAAARALAAAAGAETPPNGRLAADLVLAAEMVADHLTHFHLFFMPDFARPAHAGRPWHEAARRRFTATRGEAQAAFLPARARFLHLMGLLAGKWPHTLALQPGGTTKSIDTGEKVRLLSILHAFRSHLEGDLLGGPLEEIAALENAQALFALGERRPGADLSLFLTAARDLGLERTGRAHDRFMSAGAFGLFKEGLWDDGRPAPLDLGTITEDPAHAWLSGATAHPARGRTLPDALKPDAYTWCKAPRLSGRPVEVGALARQVIDGHPLLHDLVATNGGGVLARIAARMVETARLLPAMESWVRALAPREPYCLPCPPIETGAGLGLVEAARGTLGHWLTVSDNRIANYQIVAPTTWNFSPRDAAGQPGPLETALIGLPIDADGRASAMVHHVVRSFDPCMACTVH